MPEPYQTVGPPLPPMIRFTDDQLLRIRDLAGRGLASVDKLTPDEQARLSTIANPKGSRNDSQTPGRAALSSVKDFGKELVTGEGSGRDLALRGLKEGAKGIADVLDPVNMVEGLYGVVRHPVDAVSSIARALPSRAGPGSILEGLGKGDSRLVGQLGGSVLVPGATKGYLSVVGKAANTVAKVPGVRTGLGYLAGAGTSLLSGAGHPFIGGIMGRVSSPLLERPAAAIGSAVDRIQKALGVDQTPFNELPLYRQMDQLPDTPIPITTRQAAPPYQPLSSIPVEFREDYALLQQKYPNTSVADNWLKQQQLKGTTPPVKPSGGLGRGNVPPPASSSTAEAASGTPTASQAPTRSLSDLQPASSLSPEELAAQRVAFAARSTRPSPPITGKAPPVRTARMAEPANPAVDEMVNRINGGADTPPKGNGTFDKAIDQKSADIGAQRMGREFRTRPNSPDATGDVRNVRGYSVGTPDAHIPNQPRTTILNKMINMSDAERDAYVAKAGDLKTRTQLETMLKTVRHIEGQLPEKTSIADVLKKYGAP